MQPATTALPTSFAKVVEQPSTENRTEFSPTHVGVDEGFQVSDNTTSQDLAATGSRKPSIPSLELLPRDGLQEALLQDSVESVPSTPQHLAESPGSTPNPTDSSNTGKLCSIQWLNRRLTLIPTDRKRVVRSNNLPSSPSSPTTGASSDTFYDTPRHSATSSSPSPIEFRQALDERKEPSKKCRQALVEHLENEENAKENREWAALVEWIKIGHKAELDNLKVNHAAEVGTLRKERSEERRRLEVRNRELRTLRREMKNLEKSIEETAKDQEEIQPAPDAQSADESDGESVDEDEGGVVLATNNILPTEGHQFCGTAVGGLEYADLERNSTAEDEKKTETPAKATTKPTRERQRALKQQLLEESAPDYTVSHTGTQAVQPIAIGILTSNAAQQPTISVNGDNKGLLAQVKELRDHNKALKTNLSSTREVIGRLTSEAEAAEGEITKLRAENKFAQLEVGHCNAANACYRASAEDHNPARTAHIDGLLRRKDEIYAELEKRAAECSDQLAEETKERAIEKVHSEATIQGMKNELAHRVNTIAALTGGKNVLKEQNDEICRMFEGKIFQTDMIKAFLRDYEVIQKDNALLTKIVNERKFYVQEAEKGVADLKAEKILDEHAANADKLKYRQTQQSLNGLMYVNHQLNAKVDFQEEMREELKGELEGQIQRQAEDIRECIQWGADDWLLRRHQAQEAQIAFLNDEVNKVNGIANQWRIRALEQQDGFCPMFNFPEIADWNAEDTRWRLRDAERENDRLQRLLAQLVREGKKAEVLEEAQHDGSNWLKGRAQAREEMEHWRWIG